MRSMTGFGQARGTNAHHQITVTLRGVNHRFLDLVVRLKDEHRSAEPALRAVVESELHRGRVEAAVEVRPLQPLPVSVELQTELIRSLHDACGDLLEKGLLAAELSAGDLLRIPEVMEIRMETDQWSPEDEELLLEVGRTALEQVVESREREGRELRRVLGERLAELGTVLAALRERAAVTRERIGEDLRSRLDALLGSQELDETRLAQEVALLVDRSDVGEELDRLEAHLGHFTSLLEEDEPVGKRLEFLTQEVFRELNTLGSKCRDAEMTRDMLEAKNLCEQLREQVQNVE